MWEGDGGGDGEAYTEELSVLEGNSCCSSRTGAAVAASTRGAAWPTTHDLNRDFFELRALFHAKRDGKQSRLNWRDQLENKLLCYMVRFPDCVGGITVVKGNGGGPLAYGDDNDGCTGAISKLQSALDAALECV